MSEDISGLMSRRQLELWSRPMGRAGLEDSVVPCCEKRPGRILGDTRGGLRRALGNEGRGGREGALCYHSGLADPEGVESLPGQKAAGEETGDIP